MYLSKPVMIPKKTGKIAFDKKGGSTYVRYEIGRKYDPNRKYNIPERVGIGVQISGRPEMMLPNEHYLTYFSEEGMKMTEEERGTMEEYEEEREQQFMLRDFFDQLFFEFQIISRKRPGYVVNENKVRRINAVLEPVMKMLEGEAYAKFLEMIPEPEEKVTEDGSKMMVGMSYSDVSLLLTQFKGALNRYFQRRI